MRRRERPIWDGICDVLAEGGVGRTLMVRSGGAVGVRGARAMQQDLGCAGNAHEQWGRRDSWTGGGGIW
jgi:hypothetical protein